MATRIYTKTGDAGLTGLWGGDRVAKDNIRVEAYGAVDELNSALGWARAQPGPAEILDLISELQRLLFELGSQLATADGTTPPTGVTEHDVHFMEKAIDSAEARMKPLATFVLPGGTILSAALHMARSVCRRAERRCVTLRHAEPNTSLLTVQVLNRMGDLLFVLARFANHLQDTPDVPWRARST